MLAILAKVTRDHPCISSGRMSGFRHQTEQIIAATTSCRQFAFFAVDVEMWPTDAIVEEGVEPAIEAPSSDTQESILGLHEVLSIAKWDTA